MARSWIGSLGVQSVGVVNVRVVRKCGGEAVMVCIEGGCLLTQEDKVVLHVAPLLCDNVCI